MVGWWASSQIMRHGLWLVWVLLLLTLACQNIPTGAVGGDGVCAKHADCGSGLYCSSGLCVKGIPPEQSTAEIAAEPLDGGESTLIEPKEGELSVEPVAEQSQETPVDEGSNEGDGGPSETPAEIKPEADCSDGASRACYSGPAGTRSIGACKDGRQICSGGKWGACTDEVLPAQSELCGNGQDDNCDGVIDENCPCQYLGKSQGVCANATSDANGKCQPPSDYSDTEDCNDTLDNNCDGKVNEGCACTGQETRDCGTDVGECKKGTQQCDSGNWSTTCNGEKKPESTDKCGDNKDNDCDGAIDEGCPCYYMSLDKGVCRNATRDNAGICQPPQGYKAQEICGDSLDNNCDGKVDENCPCHYLGLAKGVCANARRDANGTCQKPTGYDPDEKCDGVDNNCNGAVDEFCPCNYLNKSKGVCVGLKRNAAGECPKPPNYNFEELCGDGKDNDCDGATDYFLPGATCLSYAKACVISGVSPSGLRDVCIRHQAYCSLTTKKCSISYGNYCESYRQAIKCRNNNDCAACNAAIGGRAFGCAKGLCLRTSL